jgi:predicted alpha/beta-fold hydrolase
VTPLADLPLPAFRPRPPWWGGDLQTLRNNLTRTTADLSPWPAERVLYDLGDGDRLAGALHRPAVAGGQERPIVVVIHGLTGCEDSIHVRVSVRHFLSEGFPVLRLNLRGSAPSRPTCRGHYHAGKSEDLAAVIEQIVGFPGIVAVGYSLGGNLLLKYLGEAGETTPIRAAVAISVPLDLAATSRHLRRPRNRVYHDYLLRRMKAEALADGAVVSDAERRAIAAATSVFEFDDRFVAPRNGFAGAADYYAKCSAQGFLDGIARPTLILHARNDPWIPPGAHLRTEWARYADIRLLLTPSGGHCGFHGAGSPVPWHDRCAAQLFENVAGAVSCRATERTADDHASTY